MQPAGTIRTANRKCERVAGHIRRATAAPPPGSPPLLLPAAAPLLLLLLLAGCSSNRHPVQVHGTAGPAFAQGTASWYGPNFHGRRTASGERYDQNALTAAHPSLPFGTQVEVTNLANGRSVVVRINDRGPFKKQRIIDLSYGAAREIGVVGPGTARVALALAGGPRAPSGDGQRYTVQVGAFADPDRAVALHHDLQGTYPEVFVHSDGIWYRVQVGLFEDRDQAESLRRELALFGMASYVIAAQ